MKAARMLLRRRQKLPILCLLAAAVCTGGIRMHKHEGIDSRNRPGMLCYSSWPWALRVTGTGARGKQSARSRPTATVAMCAGMGDKHQESQPLTVGNIIREWEEVRIPARPSSPPRLVDIWSQRNVWEVEQRPSILFPDGFQAVPRQDIIRSE